MNNLLIQRAVIVDMLYLEIPTSDDGKLPMMMIASK